MFFPSLIPGKSLVVQQDYLHWKQPWIAVQMELMAACFTPVAFAPNDTIVFRCDALVDAEMLAKGRVENLPHAHVLTALKAARERLKSIGFGNKVNRLLKAARANPEIGQTQEMVSPG